MTSSNSSLAHRRGKAVELGVLNATLTLLEERGYDFSVDDVAALAQVHKTTIYRRWETKPALVAAAMDHIAERDVPSPTGEPLAALRQLTVQVAAALSQTASANALRAAFSAAGAEHVLRVSASRYLTTRYTVATDLIRAAQTNGSLRRDVDPVLMWQAVVNPLHVNAVLGDRVDEAAALALLDLALYGALPKDNPVRTEATRQEPRHA